MLNPGSTEMTPLSCWNSQLFTLRKGSIVVVGTLPLEPQFPHLPNGDNLQDGYAY